MRKLNLQLFAEAVAGKKIVYLYRVLGDKTEATRMAFTTENGRTVSKDADSTSTKDGAIRTPSSAEIEITATSILTKGDTIIDKLESAMKADKLIEIWEANLAEPIGDNTNKFKGTYYQGYLTEFERTSSAEDYTEISMTFGINGEGATSEAGVTVSVEQQDEAVYTFVDTTAQS